MHRRRFPFYALFLVALCAGCGRAADLEPIATDDEPSYSSFGVWLEGENWDGTGSLWVEVGGEENLIADNALSWWTSENRETIYYSYRHGRSGYEAEGEGLMRYDVASKRSDLVFDDDVMILDVLEELTASGRTVLIVEMTDGGLGAPTVAIADPDRGRVFRENIGSVAHRGDGKVAIATYTAHAIADSEGVLPEPESTTVYDLDELLERPADREILYPWPPED
ncbi:MAG: hypothetical protein IH944_10555 [Armatimonadetes bacterium]|nr:hypothetical protein [Armatimonadota bacterium]